MAGLICALGPDNAGTVLTRLLQDARHEIDAAVYEVGPSYRWALTAAARRGVRVRLLLDHHPYDGNAGTAAHLVRAGGECRVLGSGAPAAHWKLLSIDQRRVAVGTGNLIWRDAPRHSRASEPGGLHGTREWWAVVADDADAELRASTAFEAAWSAGVAPPASWRLRQEVAPEVGAPSPQVGPLWLTTRARNVHLLFGGLPVAGAMGSLIARARRRVLVTVPYVHPRTRAVHALLGALRVAARRGADVRLLLGAAPLSADAAKLGALRIPVRAMDPRRSTYGHAKGVVADDAVVVTSSNWSAAGLGANWEAALAIHLPEAAEYYAAAWHRDWESARGI